MDYIYIVRTINIKPKTEEMLQKEFEIIKITSPNWQTKTYEEYMEFLHGWKWDKYEESYHDNAYCDSYKMANGKITNNACDINDSGAYNYASIIKIPLNCCYAETCINKNSHTLFKFDRSKDTYFEVSNDYNEITKWLSGK